MKYAIIQLQGKQHRVSEKQQLIVDRLTDDVGKIVSVKEVLLVVDGDKISLGKPMIEGAVVKAKVLSHDQGDKIRVATFKAKSRYRRVIGHRQQQTTLEVQSISEK